jgi:hypothetical protein
MKASAQARAIFSIIITKWAYFSWLSQTNNDDDRFLEFTYIAFICYKAKAKAKLFKAHVVILIVHSFFNF